MLCMHEYRLKLKFDLCVHESNSNKNVYLELGKSKDGMFSLNRSEHVRCCFHGKQLGKINSVFISTVLRYAPDVFLGNPKEGNVGGLVVDLTCAGAASTRDNKRFFER